MINTTRQIAIPMLLAASAGAGAQTQPASPPPPPPPDSVGNPQLRNFELPGTRTVTPPPAEQPAPPPPRAEPVPQPAPPPAARTPAPRPPASPSPAPAAPRPAAPPRAAAPAAPRPAPAPRAPAPAAVEPTAPAEPAAPVSGAPAPIATPEAVPVLPAPAPLPEPLPAPTPPAAQSVPAAPEPAEGGDTWIWLVAAIAGAGVLGLLAFRKLRRRDDDVDASQPVFVEAEPASAPEPAMAPRPVAAPRAVPPQPAPPPAAPAVNGLVGIQVRPWLELEFKPDRAAATLTDASVQYELLIRNKGNAPARNIRIEQRMFNAGPEQEREIGAFYAEPVRERTAPAIAVIPARGEMRLRNAISMPNEAVREITVQGRRLFIPTVAFNVIYDYGDGRAGQTSKSYVVGREAETPSEKMGAFRLDLGPRLYRSVGQRQTRLERIV